MTPPKFNSTELLLLAHDEWKRREERKHLHPEGHWVAGFLSGFCTSHKWAREYVDKLVGGEGMKIVQCATCFQEATIIPILQSVWKTQESFNTNYMRYQDAARKWKCADYLGAWES